MNDYDGFVYLWRDSTNGMFYLGSHFGSTDDGYVGSGVRFMHAYAKRPEAFKRRVLEYVSGSKQTVFEREQLWLNLIKTEELNTRYYNQRRRAIGRPEGERKQFRHTAESIEKMKKPKASKENYSRPKSVDHRAKLAEHLNKVKTVRRGADSALSKLCRVTDNNDVIRFEGMSVRAWCEASNLHGADVYLRDSARKGGVPIVRNEKQMVSKGATPETIAVYHLVKGWRAVYLPAPVEQE